MVVEVSMRRPLATEDCLGLLAETDIGWLAISSGARPAIVPVNFIVLSDHVIFRVERKSQLHHATAGAVVALGAGHVGDEATGTWSVQVRGVASELDSVPLLDVVSEHWAKRWPSVAGDPAFIGLAMKAITGWEFKSRGEAE